MRRARVGTPSAAYFHRVALLSCNRRSRAARSERRVPKERRVDGRDLRAASPTSAAILRWSAGVDRSHHIATTL